MANTESSPELSRLGGEREGGEITHGGSYKNQCSVE
jgi:hypothetical protein